MFSPQQHDRARELYYHHADHQAQQFDVAASLIPQPIDGLSILDVGCGYGDFVKRLDGMLSSLDATPYRYTGIDANPMAIEEARASDPDPNHKYRVSTRIVRADIILAVAVIAAEYVPPKVLLHRMWNCAEKALVFTTYAGHAPMETVVGWCPQRPDVVLASGDFFAAAMYK